MTKNKEELQSKIDNLLENVSNSLENSRNNSYKKGLYPFKIMKQLLIQLSSDVFLNKMGVPSIKVIDKNKFEDVFNIINTYVETHNIDEIEGLLYSEHISKDLGLKKCYNTDINLFIYDVEVHFETFCGSFEFCTGYSEYDKVIKNVLKQGQKSDVSKKYLNTFYKIQDNTCTVINGFPYIHDGYVKGIQVFAEHVPYEYSNMSD